MTTGWWIVYAAPGWAAGQNSHSTTIRCDARTLSASRHVSAFLAAPNRNSCAPVTRMPAGAVMMLGWILRTSVTTDSTRLVPT